VYGFKYKRDYKNWFNLYKAYFYSDIRKLSYNIAEFLNRNYPIKYLDKSTNNTTYNFLISEITNSSTYGLGYYTISIEMKYTSPPEVFILNLFFNSSDAIIRLESFIANDSSADIDINLASENYFKILFRDYKINNILNL